MLVVSDAGTRCEFAYADLLRYAGPGSPGGVALAYKLLERALAEVGAAERRELHFRTAFVGPGARDAVELVTRAVTEGRYSVDPGLRRPERGRAAERFTFIITYRDRRLELCVRDGIVTDAFADLAFASSRTPAEEDELTRLKADLAERVMALDAEDVFDLAG